MKKYVNRGTVTNVEDKHFNYRAHESRSGRRYSNHAEDVSWLIVDVPSYGKGCRFRVMSADPNQVIGKEVILKKDSCSQFWSYEVVKPVVKERRKRYVR